jgi:hypothetical protein
MNNMFTDGTKVEEKINELLGMLNICKDSHKVTIDICLDDVTIVHFEKNIPEEKRT